MAVVWTEEMKAKAAATRAETLRRKRERQRRRDEKENTTREEEVLSAIPKDKEENQVSKPWFLPTHAEWQTMDLEAVHALVQKIQACYQEGAQVLNQRKSDQSRADGTYVCVVCHKKKPQVIDNHPNYVWRDDRPDPKTRIYVTRMICSQNCYFRGSNAGSLTAAGSAFSPEKSSPKGAA